MHTPTPGKPAFASLEAIRHSLCFWGGLVATDRPDLHNLNTDRDKNTVFEIDTQNELAMVDEAIQHHENLMAALQQIKAELHAALIQRAPSDDAIIMEHIERAHEQARAAIASARQQEKK